MTVLGITGISLTLQQETPGTPGGSRGYRTLHQGIPNTTGTNREIHDITEDNKGSLTPVVADL